MKITITISDEAMKDITEYCRVTGTDLQGRMQQELDKFVSNAIRQLEQRRQVGEFAGLLQESIKRFCHGE